MKKQISSWHVGIAAEAFAAGLFARSGYDVSVQYGANQPEYDLIVVKGDLMLKVSVKGSQDGGWGLTQNFKKDSTYHEAVDKWFAMHHRGTIFCLVQFEKVPIDALPRVYLATPEEIAQRLKDSAAGRGETILYENQVWSKRAAAYGTVDAIPESWKFSQERLSELFTLEGI
jgi:Holliday junction resolvase-like predicted endonuclease